MAQWRSCKNWNSTILIVVVLLTCGCTSTENHSFCADVTNHQLRKAIVEYVEHLHLDETEYSESKHRLLTIEIDDNGDTLRYRMELAVDLSPFTNPAPAFMCKMDDIYIGVKMPLYTGMEMSIGSVATILKDDFLSLYEDYKRYVRSKKRKDTHPERYLQQDLTSFDTWILKFNEDNLVSIEKIEPVHLE